MVDCIVCRKPLSDNLRLMNMEYHPGECYKKVIKLGWHFLDYTNEDKKIENDLVKVEDINK